MSTWKQQPLNQRWACPKWVTIRQFNQLTGISKSKAARHVKDGNVDFRRDGKLILINLWKYYEDLELDLFEK